MRARRLAAGLLVVSAALVVAGCGSVSSPDAAAPAAPSSATAQPSDQAEPGGPSGVGTASVPGPAPGAAPVAVPRGQRPVRIAIPAIGVDAAMTELGIATDGTIEVPDVPAEAGWLDTSPAPGQQGPAVVAGHVDSTSGPAVFYRLGTLEPGDEVVVTRRDGSRASFSVDGVRTYPQDAFPTRAVYGPVPGPALRLVTCGGAYRADDGGYQSNVVVYAS